MDKESKKTIEMAINALQSKEVGIRFLTIVFDPEKDTNACYSLTTETQLAECALITVTNFTKVSKSEPFKELVLERIKTIMENDNE